MSVAGMLSKMCVLSKVQQKDPKLYYLLKLNIYIVLDSKNMLNLISVV